MRKLLSIVIAIVIVAILLGVGAIGYLWYSTKQEVDHLVTEAKPFADISYGGIDVSLAGSMGVNRLRIRPIVVNDSISIGAIRLNTPNFLALLNVRWQLSQNQLPEALALAFHDFELSLSGGILGIDPAGYADESSPFAHLDALGCGPITAFGAPEWRAMGYDRFLGNVEIGYRIDSKNNVLELRMDNDMRDWATLNLSIGLALTQPPKSLMELPLSLTPKLAKLNFMLRDDGFNQRRNAYCAAQAGKPLSEYLADHIQRVVERLRANGITPGPGLIAAYQGYLTEGGVLTITAAPPAPINPAELREYTPADSVKLLGLRMKVNDVAVTDLTVDWDAAKLARAMNVKLKPALETEPESSATSAPPPSPPTPVVVEKIAQTYHTIPVGELGRHVGKIVKLRTVSGTQYRGQLHSATEDFIHITVRKSGGSAVLSLRTHDITETEVLY
ncbi:MAG: hypothetical protein U1F70_12775 [Candidatus Competibacteraceae bacterium]